MEMEEAAGSGSAAGAPPHRSSPALLPALSHTHHAPRRARLQPSASPPHRRRPPASDGAGSSSSSGDGSGWSRGAAAAAVAVAAAAASVANPAAAGTFRLRARACSCTRRRRGLSRHSRFGRVQATFAYRLEVLCDARAMHRQRERAREEGRAYVCMICTLRVSRPVD